MFNKYNLKYYSKIFGVFVFLLISSFILISCSDNDLKNLTSRSQGFINSWQNGNMEEIYTKYISYRMKEKCDLDNFVNINNNELENWKRNSDFVNWDKNVSITIDRIKIVKPTSQKEKEKIEQGEKLLGNYKSVNHLQGFVSVKWLYKGESLSYQYTSYPALYWRFIDRGSDKDWYIESFEISEFVPETLDCLIYVTPNSIIFDKLPVLDGIDINN